MARLARRRLPPTHLCFGARHLARFLSHGSSDRVIVCQVVDVDIYIHRLCKHSKHCQELAFFWLLSSGTPCDTWEGLSARFATGQLADVAVVRMASSPPRRLSALALDPPRRYLRLFGPRSSRPTAPTTMSNSLAATTIVLLLCGSSLGVSHADLVLQGSHVNLPCALCVRRSQRVQFVMKHRRASHQNELHAQNLSCRSTRQLACALCQCLWASRASHTSASTSSRLCTALGRGLRWCECDSREL